MDEVYYNEISDINRKKINNEKKINILIMKINNNLILEISKDKIYLEEEDIVSKKSLLELINNLKKNNYNIKYLLKYNLKKNIFDIDDDEINNVEIIHKIEDINFKDEKNLNFNYEINLYDCLIFIIEKKEFLKMKKYVKKNGTKKNGTKKI